VTGLVEYTVGAELPDKPFRWLDGNGNLIPFATTPHTFTLRIGVYTCGVALFTKTTGITGVDTDPNVTVAFTAGELPGSLEVGVRYLAQLWARRTSDSKDRDPLEFVFRMKPGLT
jgi:hypothetical protein